MALRHVLPLAVLGVLSAGAVTNWPGSGSSLLAALLPAAALNYWAVRRASFVPEIAILFCGLAVDIVSGGSLGFWACIYASAWICGLLGRSAPGSQWKVGRWVHFAVSMAIVTALVHGLGTLLGKPVAPFGALMATIPWLVAIYPLLAFSLGALDGPRSRFPLECD